MKEDSSKYTLHQIDLPETFEHSGAIAVDTETMGLNLWRDRLCLVQVSSGDGCAHLIQIVPGQKSAPRLTALLLDPDVQVICHFARFDVASIYKAFGVLANNIYCTRTAAKLVRTNTDRHGLKDLCSDFLGIELDKEEQTSDWGSDTLTDRQLGYAANDVLYLHRLMEHMNRLLVREQRIDIATACFNFIPTLAAMDVQGWYDIFEH